MVARPAYVVAVVLELAHVFSRQDGKLRHAVQIEHACCGGGGYLAAAPPAGVVGWWVTISKTRLELNLYISPKISQFSDCIIVRPRAIESDQRSPNRELLRCGK